MSSPHEPSHSSQSRSTRRIVAQHESQLRCPLHLCVLAMNERRSQVNDERDRPWASAELVRHDADTDYDYFESVPLRSFVVKNDFRHTCVGSGRTDSARDISA